MPASRRPGFIDNSADSCYLSISHCVLGAALRSLLLKIHFVLTIPRGRDDYPILQMKKLRRSKVTMPSDDPISPVRAVEAGALGARPVSLVSISPVLGGFGNQTP